MGEEKEGQVELNPYLIRMEGSSKEEFNPLDFDEGLGYKVGSLKAKFEKKKKKNPNKSKL